MEQVPAPTLPVSNIPPPWKHQEHITKFTLEKREVLNWSDPGTGKTRGSLDAVSAARRAAGDGRAIVIAPKAILEPAWVNDCQQFTPHLRIAAAYAHNREKAFKSGADIVVTNHDAAKWLADRPELLKGFTFLFIDESTAYKNRTAQRSRAMAKIAPRFDIRVEMTGTPMPNGVLDLWHQVLLVDGGTRLGKQFFKFRSAVCEPRQVGPRPEMVDWIEKEGARDAVVDLLRDITLRYRLEECHDMPETVMYPVEYDLPSALRKQYDKLAEEAVLALTQGEVLAINAAALRTKLLQVASGAVYDGTGQYHTLDDTRAELIAELCEQRPHSLVAFQWTHQRDQIAAALQARGLHYAIIDGTTAQQKGEVPRIVQQFQDGAFRVLLAQPQSASHGLTLTRATTTIWASPPPTIDAERFIQFNRRAYRAGQKLKTEVILVQARDTLDLGTYARTQGKVSNQSDVLDLMEDLIKPMKEAA